MQLNVLILYNRPVAAEGGFSESEASVLQEVGSVETALKELAIPYRTVGADTFKDVSGILAQSPEPVVFNLIEGFGRNSVDANYIPALCRSAGKGCTGSDTPALMYGLDKWQSKLILQAFGLPTPNAVLIPIGCRAKKSQLPPAPYIVKPAAADASEGIDSHSVVARAGAALNELVVQIHSQFDQPALVEQFVGKREINVSIIQMGDEVRVLPLAEIDFSAFGEDKLRIVGYTAKWLADTFEYKNTPHLIPAPLPAAVANRIRQYSLDAWHAVGCQDYARVDFRLDEKGMPFIIEVNPNPDVSPEGGLTAALAAANIPYSRFIEAAITNAYTRIQSATDGNGGSASHKGKVKSTVAKIRHAVSSDRQTVLNFIKATNFFRPDEIDVATEVFDDAIAGGQNGHYQSYVIEENKKPVGWVCFGPTPCTVGTYDLYWIVVDPTCQAKGYGKTLMDFAESQIKKYGGRLVVVETSAQPRYLPTRKFYLKIGYLESSRVWDFYAPGDDKIIYIKRL
jgi:D-alanine-D-alanine ligase